MDIDVENERYVSGEILVRVVEVELLNFNEVFRDY